MYTSSGMGNKERSIDASQQWLRKAQLERQIRQTEREYPLISPSSAIRGCLLDKELPFRSIAEELASQARTGDLQTKLPRKKSRIRVRKDDGAPQLVTRYSDGGTFVTDGKPEEKFKMDYDVYAGKGGFSFIPSQYEQGYEGYNFQSPVLDEYHRIAYMRSETGSSPRSTVTFSKGGEIDTVETIIKRNPQLQATSPKTFAFLKERYFCHTLDFTDFSLEFTDLGKEPKFSVSRAAPIKDGMRMKNEVRSYILDTSSDPPYFVQEGNAKDIKDKIDFSTFITLLEESVAGFPSEYSSIQHTNRYPSRS